MGEKEGDLPVADRIGRLEDQLKGVREEHVELKIAADRWKWMVALVVTLAAALPLGTVALGVLKKGEKGDDGRHGRNGLSAPIGSVVAWPGALDDNVVSWTEPDGSVWHICDGTPMDAGEYGALLDALGGSLADELSGSPYGWEGGKFKLPDFQGMFLRGADGEENHVAFPLGKRQEHQLAEHQHILSERTMGIYGVAEGKGLEVYASPGKDGRAEIFGMPTGVENRPVNYAVHWIIRVK